jgi:small-conductance mechanosensitive channel
MMPTDHRSGPSVPLSKRNTIFLWIALLLLLVVIAIDFGPYEASGVVGMLNSDVHRFLTMRLFSLGQVSISILFLLKSALFLLLLSVAAARVRTLLYARLRRTAVGEARGYLLARFAAMGVYALGLLVGLEWTGLNLNTLAIVGGTLGIGIGFGLQQVVGNWVAGLVLLVEQPIRIGDVINVRGLSGVVVRIGGRSTWVRTYDDEVVIIPNSDLTNHQVVNWTANDLKVRLSIPVGVGYQSNIEQVRATLMQIMSANPEVLQDPAPEVIFQALGDSSLNFLLRFWAEVLPDRDHYGLKSDLYLVILKRFREQGIEIPFPQRDVHLRTTDVPPAEQPGPS